jgi:DNA-binding transcriptional MocR family regulator
MTSLQINRKYNIQNQIVSYFREEILSKKIADGTKLPTVRLLSQELSVSPLTVTRAYKKLESEGLVNVLQGSGTFANLLQSDVTCNEFENSQNYDWMLLIDDNLKRTQFANEFSIEQLSRGYNMFTSVLNSNDYPYEDVKKLLAKVVKDDPVMLFKYSPVCGDDYTRKIVSSYLRKYGDLNVRASNLIMTSGSQQALHMIARTFVKYDDIVLMETPTFPGAIDAFQNQGCKIISVPIEQDGINIEYFEMLVKKHKPKLLYITPNISNPSGIITSNEKRKHILEIANQNQLLIIEDDPWGEFAFDSNKFKLLKSFDLNGNVILVKGFSKLIGPGLRMGAIYANGTIFNRLITAKANSDLGSPLLTQRLLSEIIVSGVLSNFQKEMQILIDKKLTMLMQSLKKYAPKYLKWITPDGGINIWLELPANLNTDTFLKEYCHPNDITFLSGRLCYPNEPLYNMCRLSFASLELNEIDHVIQLFCKLLKEYYTDTLNNKS